MYKTTLGIALGALLIPVVAFAQTSDLRASIRVELMKDPRTAQMSQAEVDALVEALALSAQSDGVTTRDLSWQPEETVYVLSTDEHINTCGFRCTLAERLRVPLSVVDASIVAAIIALLFAFITYEFVHRRKGVA